MSFRFDDFPAPTEAEWKDEPWNRAEARTSLFVRIHDDFWIRLDHEALPQNAEYDLRISRGPQRGLLWIGLYRLDNSGESLLRLPEGSWSEVRVYSPGLPTRPVTAKRLWAIFPEDLP